MTKSNVEDQAQGELLELKPEDSRYLQQDRLMASPPPMALMARDLAAFFRVSNAISEVKGLEPLKKRLLEVVGEVVPADSGAILLVGDDPEQFDSVYGWRRDQEEGQSVAVERRLVKQALREREALLVRLQDGADAGSSVLCLPLTAVERPVAALYLATEPEGQPISEDQMQFLTAISGILAVALENARNIEWLKKENRRLRRATDIKHDMVGASPAMEKIYRFISKVAPTDSTVLIEGESGTGKELAARAIHHNSPRADKPFVAINCATLSEALLESELFGHEKGAFTGAVKQKRGKLELADGGTLFLDELGDLAPGHQAKLLRVLQESEFERVGGTSPIHVDIRLIAATNKSLEKAIQDGSFREDLYYRLNVVSFAVPPLRERIEDIPQLATHFAVKHGAKSNRRVLGVSPEGEECLINYPWPGNVRELENAIERAVVMGSEEFIQPEDLPEHILETGTARGGYSPRYHEAIKQFRKDVLLKALRRSAGNFTKAAQSLGIHPNYLHRMVTQLDLRDEVERIGNAG
ncbi:MAG TPA: sigma 54-interacting transcriptional regulator [Acidobacteriota bacterium]|nr:sigma 54-interacting transcriptional regulator [Acidobacteriota bacterium]